MTGIKSRLVDGMRGQGIRLPNGDWLRLDDNNLELIAERLQRTPGIAIADRGRFENALLDAWDCGNATGLDGPLDREASRYNRQRDADLILTALSAAAVQAQEEQP